MAEHARYLHSHRSAFRKIKKKYAPYPTLHFTVRPLYLNCKYQICCTGEICVYGASVKITVTSRRSELTDGMQIVLRHESRFAAAQQEFDDIAYRTSRSSLIHVYLMLREIPRNLHLDVFAHRNLTGCARSRVLSYSESASAFEFEINFSRALDIGSISRRKTSTSLLP